MGKHEGGLRYRGIIISDSYVEEGCQVLMHSDEGPKPYLARVECLWEHPATSEPMVTCRWFYRREDVPCKLFEKPSKGVRSNCWTIRKGSGRPKEVFDNEVFMSNIMDDNPVDTIIGLCDVYIGKKVLDHGAGSPRGKHGDCLEEQSRSRTGGLGAGGESDAKRTGKDEQGSEGKGKNEKISAAEARDRAAASLEKYVCRMSYAPVEVCVHSLKRTRARTLLALTRTKQSPYALHVPLPSCMRACASKTAA